MDVSLLRAERQGEAGYEAAKGDVSRPDRHLFTVIVTALVTRKDLCEVGIRTGQTEVAVFTAYEPEE